MPDWTREPPKLGGGKEWWFWGDGLDPKKSKPVKNPVYRTQGVDDGVPYDFCTWGECGTRVDKMKGWWLPVETPAPPTEDET